MSAQVLDRINKGIERIALIDDDDIIIDLIKCDFKRNYPEVHIETFSDPESFLLKHEIYPFDIIVTDYQMPGMVGTELILQAWSINSDTVPIIYTAYSPNGSGWEEAELLMIKGEEHSSSCPGKSIAEEIMIRAKNIARCDPISVSLKVGMISMCLAAVAS